MCQTDILTARDFRVDITTSDFGLTQIIKEPKHILNSSASCIDVIFTSKLNKGRFTSEME